MSDIIHISALKANCIVGVRPDEREREQSVVLDVELELDLRPAGRSGRIRDTCDYDRVTTEITALLRFRRFRLIEAAVEEIAAMLLGIYPMLQKVRVRLEKPMALHGRARAAAVAIERRQTESSRRTETTRFGHVEILLETAEAGLYLLHVDSGKSIPPHHHKIMRELEWLVSGELEQNGCSLTVGRPVEWSRGAVHGYINRGERGATLFCCDCPAFIPLDEIEQVVK
jgi:FolB domain-containing protein